MSMTFDSILTAIAQDVPVERQCHPTQTCFAEWRKPTSKTQALAWLLSDKNHCYRWRIAEPDRKPVPPGDLTVEEAQSLKDAGVECEWWKPYGKSWISCKGVSVPLRHGYAYRRKPAPRMVPLEAQDVPPGSFIRQIGYTDRWSLVVGLRQKHGDDLDGVGIIGRGGMIQISWEELRGYEITKDGGKTWSKCEKEATC